MESENVGWRGTPGVGDFMMALNAVHYHSWKTGKVINLEMHWEHSEDHLHHFEDPETIIERMEYIHNFYHDKERVKVFHAFNSRGKFYYDESNKQQRNTPNKKRWDFGSGEWEGRIPTSDWLFRKDAFKPTVKGKCVIWRPLFNAEKPRTWKRLLTNWDWDVIIEQLARAGLDVVELSYRTPVSEAMYHVSTAEVVICYDGMWHYIARNFCTPTIVISHEGVTKYNTPHCLKVSHHRLQPDNIFQMTRPENIEDTLAKAKASAEAHYDKKTKLYDRAED